MGTQRYGVGPGEGPETTDNQCGIHELTYEDRLEKLALLRQQRCKDPSCCQGHVIDYKEGAGFGFDEGIRSKQPPGTAQLKLTLRKAVSTIEWVLKQKISDSVRKEIMKVYPSLRK